MENNFYENFSQILKVSSLKKSRYDENEDVSIEAADSDCIHSVKNKLVRVQYPGIVDNLDKALETLGGVRNIEKAVANPSHKLQLNFHPDNKFNKGCVADCDSKSNGLLLKIKIDRSCKGNPNYTYEIVGLTVKNISFNKLLDFQYLPLVADHPETSESPVHYIHDLIFPKQLPSFESLKKCEKSVPLFILPVSFSRTDLRRRLHVEKQKDDQPKTSKQCIGMVRTAQPSIFHKFTDVTVPEGPSEFIKNYVSTRSYGDLISKIEKLFKERPIWTKNGLKYNTGFSNDILKLLIPCVAYYTTSGPWRSTWIRFNYDPRKHSDARIYQVLDYRIPGNLKSCPRTPEVFSGQRVHLTDDAYTKRSRIYPEQIYILKPKVMPAYRQNFYQYCDIHLPEVKVMLERLPTVSPNTRCDVRNGWLPSNFSDQCREIINSYLENYLKEIMGKNIEGTVAEKSVTPQEIKSTDYQSLIIRNVRRGLYGTSNNKIDLNQPSSSSSNYETEDITEILESDESVIGSDNDSVYQDFIQDEWMDQEDLQVEIDADALQDVKNIIASSSFTK